MMLVISVIVAVAILGVLLGFLGNIGFNVANAKTVLPDLIQTVSNKGFGTEAKDNVDFTKGDVIYVENMITGTSIPARNLKVCIGTALSGSGGALAFTSASDPRDASINVNAGVKAAIAVCKGRGIDMKVYISDTKDDAVSNCVPSRVTSC